MDVFFCDACAKLRGTPGVCSYRCENALAAAKLHHTTRAGSRVVVPVNSQVGRIFAQVCAVTHNKSTDWRNYRGDFVLPAGMVDGVSAIGAIRNDADVQRTVSKVTTDIVSGALTTDTLAEFADITPEMMLHILPHLPHNGAIQLGRSGGLPRQARSALESFLREKFELQIANNKLLLAKEKQIDMQHAEERRQKRLVFLEKREKQIEVLRDTTEDTMLFGWLSDELPLIHAKSAELKRAVKTEPYGTALTPTERDIAAHVAFFLSQTGTMAMEWNYFLSSLSKRTDDEKRTTQSIVFELPEVRNSDAPVRARKIFTDVSLSAQEKTAQANALLDEPFLRAPKPLTSNTFVAPAIDINIEGPYVLQVYYSPIEDKTIALVGEIHMQEGGSRLSALSHVDPLKVCPIDGKEISGIANYVRAVVFRASAMIDLFVEHHPQFQLGEFNELTYLTDLVHQGMALAKKRKDLVRFHWTDIRREDRVDAYFKTLYDFITGQSTLLWSYKFPKSLDDPRLRSLYKQVKGENVNPRVSRFVEDTFALRVSTTIMRQYADNVDKATAHFDMFIAMMDLYTIGRMFKTYVSENVIVYTGARHSANLATYLEQLGCVRLEHRQNLGSESNCMPLRRPYDHNFFFAPLQSTIVSQGFEEVAALLVRPWKYTKANEYAPRFSLIGVLAGDFMQYNDEALKVLSCYRDFGFIFYITYAFDETSAMSIFIRSLRFVRHSLQYDKTLMATYTYNPDEIALLPPATSASLMQLLKNLKRDAPLELPKTVKGPPLLKDFSKTATYTLLPPEEVHTNGDASFSYSGDFVSVVNAEFSGTKIRVYDKSMQHLRAVLKFDMKPVLIAHLLRSDDLLVVYEQNFTHNILYTIHSLSADINTPTKTVTLPAEALGYTLQANVSRDERALFVLFQSNSLLIYDLINHVFMHLLNADFKSWPPRWHSKRLQILSDGSIIVPSSPNYTQTYMMRLSAETTVLPFSYDESLIRVFIVDAADVGYFFYEVVGDQEMTVHISKIDCASNTVLSGWPADEFLNTFEQYTFVLHPSGVLHVVKGGKLYRRDVM